MKYEFKIRFNTEHLKTPGLYWRVLINEEERLVSDILINDIPVRTVSHTTKTGEQKWSISCHSNSYRINENNVIEINNG